MTDWDIILGTDHNSLIWRCTAYVTVQLQTAKLAFSLMLSVVDDRMTGQFSDVSVATSVEDDVEIYLGLINTKLTA